MYYDIIKAVKVYVFPSLTSNYAVERVWRFVTFAEAKQILQGWKGIKECLHSAP